MSFNKQKIWIIGASSGIGRQLSIQLANQGAHLILSARRESELKKLQQEIKSESTIYPLDVANLIQVQKTCLQIAQTGLDRVIFMPALYQPSAIANINLEFASKMIDVNIKGALYIVRSVLPLFEQQQSGQIVLCGSIAGYTGLPNGQPYSSTKAAIINLAESLYSEAPDYLDVKLISPGFVSTPMTDKNNFQMPMIITAQDAATEIIKGLNQKRFEIHFPKKLTIILKLLLILPYTLTLRITKKIKKSGFN